MIDRAQGPEGYYGVLGTHDDYRDTAFSDGMITTALAKGVAVVSAAQMLDWLDGRNASSITAGTFANGVLTFQVAADARARNLTLMVPAQSALGAADGDPARRRRRAVHARDDQGRGLRARERHQRHVRGARIAAPAPAGPFTLWPASDRARRTRPSPTDTELGGARRALHRRRERLREGHPLLQGPGQHRHAPRQPVERHRHAAGDGRLRERDGQRLAAGALRDARADHAPAPSTSPRTSRGAGATRTTRGTSTSRTTTRRCTPCPTARAATASTTTGRRAPSPPTRSMATNYWVDVVFDTHP